MVSVSIKKLRGLGKPRPRLSSAARREGRDRNNSIVERYQDTGSFRMIFNRHMPCILTYFETARFKTLAVEHFYYPSYEFRLRYTAYRGSEFYKRNRI